MKNKFLTEDFTYSYSEVGDILDDKTNTKDLFFETVDQYQIKTQELEELTKKIHNLNCSVLSTKDVLYLMCKKLKLTTISFERDGFVYSFDINNGEIRKIELTKL